MSVSERMLFMSQCPSMIISCRLFADKGVNCFTKLTRKIKHSKHKHRWKHAYSGIFLSCYWNPLENCYRCVPNRNPFLLPVESKSIRMTTVKLQYICIFLFFFVHIHIYLTWIMIYLGCLGNVYFNLNIWFSADRCGLLIISEGLCRPRYTCEIFTGIYL